jgi:beta-glucosidase
LSDVSAFTARVAKATTGSATIEVRLGSPTGQLVGTAQVPSTGNAYTYTTTTTPLTRTTGRHDVYLVLGAGLRLATFSLQ